MSDWLAELVRCAQSQIEAEDREALWMRGVTDAQIEHFRVGVIHRLPDGLPEEFRKWSFGGQKIRESFVLPMTNVIGEIRGVQFRNIDPTITGYLTFQYSDEPVFFGLHQAMPHVWKSRTIGAVEGAFDLFPIQRIYPDVVSTQTARVSYDLQRLIRRIADDLWLFYDSDGPGRDGAARVKRNLEDAPIRVHIAKLPQPRLSNGKLAKDPANLWEAWGDERLGVYLRELRDPLGLST